MTRVTLDRVSQVLEPAFAAGDPTYGEKEQERANVELIGRMFQVIAQGRFEELRNYLTDDVALEIAAPERVPWVRHAVGAEDVAAAIADNFRSVCEQNSEPIALVSQGDTVMVMGRESGRFCDNREPYEVLLAQQYSFRDGRLAVFRSVVGEIGVPAEQPA